jgi:hypothetical protein
MTPDETLRTTWTLFKATDGVVEVRALNCGGRSRAWHGWAAGTVMGYFDDADAFVEAVTLLDGTGQASGIYVTLNPVHPDLLARANNRLVGAKRGETTADKDILHRRWLLIDFDPVRPVGISSSTAELQRCLAVARQSAAALAEQGWPKSTPAASGNGIHLLYPLDLSNDAAATEMVKALLRTVAVTWQTEQVQIDITNFNAGRITKLYGTVARKGDPTDQRPHRRAIFLPKDDVLLCPNPDEKP